MYNGKVKMSSWMLEEIPRLNASERVLTLCARESSDFADLREMKSLVPRPER